MLTHLVRLTLVPACFLLAVTTAPAYVDLSPTLARIVNESQTITVAEVERFNADKGVVVLKRVRDLKGTTSDGPVNHQVVRANETAIDRAVLEWAEPGRQCVVFTSGKMTVVCVGEGWYQAQSSDDGWWRMGPARPDLPLAYYGTVWRLAEAIPNMLAGKTAVITTLPHGIDREGASFDLALNRAGLPGFVRVQRLRAHLRMPNMALGIGANPAYVLGAGRAAPEDVPALREKLRSGDASVRAESAADLGFLGSSAAAAAGDLAKLLDDATPRVRMAAASALLRIAPKDARAIDMLAQGLTSKDSLLRRHAARSTGLAGAAATPLAGRLGALLSDRDALVRRMALQAIATIGPAAADALPAVTALLDQPQTAVDAADALGRLGPKARPALKPLARLLHSEAPAERWAAVRAMSQIGGDDAVPAVQFMIHALPTAAEVDSYNMMIYLSLLGPVAREALPFIQKARLKNPVLRQSTTWAINPGDELPWLGPMGASEVGEFILESYVRELGDHLKPVAQRLARRIMDGKAGSVPAWGYKLLARFPDQTLPILTAGLTANELVQRERAAVALGFMGRPAQSAAPQVARALKTAQDEREQRLLQWCMRELVPAGTHE
jgi:HEAT repeat protein